MLAEGRLALDTGAGLTDPDVRGVEAVSRGKVSPPTISRTEPPSLSKRFVSSLPTNPSVHGPGACTLARTPASRRCRLLSSSRRSLLWKRTSRSRRTMCVRRRCSTLCAFAPEQNVCTSERIAACRDKKSSTWPSWVGVKAAYLRLRNTLTIFMRTRSAPSPGTSWLTDCALNVVARARYAGQPVHGLARRHYRTGGRQPGRVSELSLRTFFGSQLQRLDLAAAAVAGYCRLPAFFSRVSLGLCTVKACVTASLLT